MPNHVHLIVVPRDVVGLGHAIGEAHRRYTNYINARGRWTGHLFQSRFSSVVMFPVAEKAREIRGTQYLTESSTRDGAIRRSWISIVFPEYD